MNKADKRKGKVRKKIPITMPTCSEWANWVFFFKLWKRLIFMHLIKFCFCQRIRTTIKSWLESLGVKIFFSANKDLGIHIHIRNFTFKKHKVTYISSVLNTHISVDQDYFEAWLFSSILDVQMFAFICSLENNIRKSFLTIKLALPLQAS